MVALVLVLAAVLAVATSAVIRLVLRDGYGPVRTRPDYDTRSPSLGRS